MRFRIIAMIEVENERATLQKILTSLFEVEVKLPASMQAGVMSGGLEHRMVTRPLARTQRGQNEFATRTNRLHRRGRRRRLGSGGRRGLCGGRRRGRRRRGKLAGQGLRLLAEVGQLEYEIPAVQEDRHRGSVPTDELRLDRSSSLVRPFVDFHLAEGRTGKEGDQKKEGQLHHGFHGRPI